MKSVLLLLALVTGFAANASVETSKYYCQVDSPGAAAVAGYYDVYYRMTATRIDGTSIRNFAVSVDRVNANILGVSAPTTVAPLNADGKFIALDAANWVSDTSSIGTISMIAGQAKIILSLSTMEYQVQTLFANLNGQLTSASCRSMDDQTYENAVLGQ